MKELNGNRVEGELLRTVLYSLVASFIVAAAFYYAKLQYIPNVMSKYGFYLFFASIGYAFLIPAVRQVRAYKELPCMSGMMVGMTMGMIAGFLSGFFLASTNGMFIGSIFGMAVGISMGVWMGKCCGIMGFLEGIMAGFMGGLMGAMTSFMLLNDHLKAATVIVSLVAATILCSLHYMVYKEMKETERQRKEDHMLTIALSTILTCITIILMVLGPRSGLLQ